MAKENPPVKDMIDYLGDGVYAAYDGSGILLLANDHTDPTDKIYLEPEVFSALVKFDQRCKGEV